MTPRPVKFARLKVLCLQKYDTAIEWNDVSTLFSNVVLPVLKALDIPSDSSDFNQQCATLQDWLPTWPLLEELTLTRPHQGFRADASQELQKLQGACKNRSPPVSFDYPH